MAEASIVPAKELLSKRVQEMVLNGEEPQAPYICRVDGTRQDDSNQLLNPIPIIDLSLLSSPDPTAAQEELKKLRAALSTWGCFQAIGHGIPKQFLNKIRQVAREFFQQPMEEKQKYGKAVGEHEGYGGDPPPAEGVSLNWSDRLFLEAYPKYIRNLKLWPDNPKSFREVLEDYTAKMKTFTELVSRAIAKSLHLEENCFLNQVGEKALLRARFSHYSTYQRPDLVIGLRAHQDGSVFTIILQDDVEGLQVLKDERWLTVPTNISDSLLVLMGDQMVIMTNGIFKSPVHRVLVNSEKERTSLVILFYPDPHREIGPEEMLINEERPSLYQRVKCYSDLYWEKYLKGESALDFVQV